MDKQRIKVAIAGTGCVGRGLALLLNNLPDFELTGILTRRKGPISDLLVNQALVTNNAHQVMEGTDVLVVSTGDVVYSTEIIRLAFSYKLPVVTMDADTQIVSGSWLAKQGRLTEAEGDQPGCLAALKEEVMAMGFQPLVLGNIKGFLNQNPTMEEMSFWSKKQGFSLHSVTSFTDGTKLQTEQCLVANGLGADILKQGLTGEHIDDLQMGAFRLAEQASAAGKIISDYIISPTAPPGVFIVAEHDRALAGGLKAYKMGDGPYYLHYKPYHLCYFEVPKTIRRFVHEQRGLLDNGSKPHTGVAAVAKRDLQAGSFIDTGIGSLMVRGEAMELAALPNMVPIGLLNQAWLKKKVEAGQVLTFDDVDIPESTALTAWEETMALHKTI